MKEKGWEKKKKKKPSQIGWKVDLQHNMYAHMLVYTHVIIS